PDCGTTSPLAEPNLQSGRRTRHWTTKLTETSSTRFRPLPGLSDLHFCAANQALAELNVKLAGAPVGFRIEVDRSGPMRPGPVRFTPDRRHDSFSLAFIQRLPKPSRVSGHTISVEWRSPTGAPAELRHGSLDLTYRGPAARC